MQVEPLPTLTDVGLRHKEFCLGKMFGFCLQAHQQIRLGDGQSSAQKWTAAMNFYRRAIGSFIERERETPFRWLSDYFRAIQNALDDPHLISIIDAQIEQCEKTIHLCQLKDRAEQVRPFSVVSSHRFDFV